MSPQAIADFHAAQDFEQRVAALIADIPTISPVLKRLHRAGFGGAELAEDCLLSATYRGGDLGTLTSIARAFGEIDGRPVEPIDVDEFRQEVAR